MDESMREQRYKRLQFLLTKSNMYTHYLLKRMQNQKEQEEKRVKLREQRKARKEAKVRENIVIPNYTLIIFCAYLILLIG